MGVLFVLCIIVNDGSPDATSAVARKLIDTYPTMSISLIEQENMGPAAARNSGIRAARGQWLVPLDSDDMLAKDFLRTAQRIIDENPHISLIAGMVKEFGARESSWQYTMYSKESLPDSDCPPCVSAYRRSLWTAVGGYSPSNPWGLENWHFWLKCMGHGWVPFFCAHPMLHYRIHPGTSMLDLLKIHWDEVLSLHHTMMGKLYDIGTIQSAHVAIMNMSEDSRHRIQARCECFPHLPLPWFWLGLDHEGRGELPEAIFAYLKALHLETKSPEYPGGSALQWQVQFRLYHVYMSMGLHQKSSAARKAAQSLEPDLCAPLAEQDSMLTLAASAAQSDKKRILLMGEFFWPSLGGIETFLGHLGDFLTSNGYEVHVVTKTLPERVSGFHKGMQIHEFPTYPFLNRGVLGGLDDFDFLVQQGGFSHVICLSHLDPLAMYLCVLSEPRPTVIFMPLLQNYMDFIKQKSLAGALRVISNADHVCRIMESGVDSQLLELAQIPNSFVPHMVPRLCSEYRFRESFGLEPDMPIFLHVANFWPFKNHIKLIEVMQSIPSDWRMIMIGSPHDKNCLAKVRAAVQGDERFLLLERQPRHITAAAILEADVVMLGSWYEGCPMVILEAMSAGTPWIATPGCGSVVDQAGGFVTDLENFPLVLPEMINDRSVKKRLGELGQEHWRECFNPEAVLPAFIKLIEKGGDDMPDLRMPESIRAENQNLWRRVKDRIAFTQGISFRLRILWQ